MTDPSATDGGGDGTDSPKTGRTEAIPIGDRERLRREFDRFTEERGTVTETDEELACEFASARFAIRSDDTIVAGMPLHGFEGTVEALRFDHAEGMVTALGSEARIGGERAEGEEIERRTEYTFRRP